MLECQGGCGGKRNTRGQSGDMSMTEEDRGGKSPLICSVRFTEQLLPSRHCSQNCGYGVNKAEKGLEAGEIDCCSLWDGCIQR